MNPTGPLRQRVYKAQSQIHGLGCFARVDLAAGTYIGTYAGRPARRDGTYVLWVEAPGVAPEGRSGSNLLR